MALIRSGVLAWEMATALASLPAGPAGRGLQPGSLAGRAR